MKVEKYETFIEGRSCYLLKFNINGLKSEGTKKIGRRVALRHLKTGGEGEEGKYPFQPHPLRGSRLRFRSSRTYKLLKMAESGRYMPFILTSKITII